MKLPVLLNKFSSELSNYTEQWFKVEFSLLLHSFLLAWSGAQGVTFVRSSGSKLSRVTQSSSFWLRSLLGLFHVSLSTTARERAPSRNSYEQNSLMCSETVLKYFLVFLVFIFLSHFFVEVIELNTSMQWAKIFHGGAHSCAVVLGLFHISLTSLSLLSHISPTSL